MLKDREKRRQELIAALRETLCTAKAGAMFGMKRTGTAYWRKTLGIDARSVICDRQKELVEAAIAGGCKNKTQITFETGLTPKTVDPILEEIGFTPIRAAHQLLGQTFGDLTVRSVVSTGRVECVCACGRTIEVAARGMNDGRAVRCRTCAIACRRDSVPVIGQTTGRRFESIYAASKALKMPPTSVIYAIRRGNVLDGELWDAG
jgi:hypothetical protein